MRRRVRANKWAQETSGKVKKKFKGAFVPTGYDLPWPNKLADVPYAPDRNSTASLTFQMQRLE